jgi:two-component system nitrogen regulation response regulator NtrX
MGLGTILVVDDEALVRDSLRDVLLDEDYEVFAVSTSAEAQDVLKKSAVDLVLLDVWLGHEDGSELLSKFLNSPSQPVVVMMSGHASIDSAVKCTKLGAYDFLEKPISIERMLLTMTHALDARRLRLELDHLKTQKLKTSLTGRSRAALELHQLVSSVAKSPSSVLICGENGVGKEIVARLLHSLSPRAESPFVAVNCAAIPDSLIESELFGYERGAFTGAVQSRMGRIESANTGTLFLDEIGDLSLSAQAKLLRVIQERIISRLGGKKEVPVQIRWIAATNKNLDQMVKDGSFREDLLFRLNVIRIDVQPLRNRKEDIEPLALQFLREACLEGQYPLKYFSKAALDKLSTYHWPGNVRELRNVIERAVAISLNDEIKNEDISFSMPVMDIPPDEEIPALTELLAVSNFREARQAFERAYLKNQMSKNKDGVGRLAQQIGLERTYLYRKLKQHQLDGSGGS